MWVTAPLLGAVGWLIAPLRRAVTRVIAWAVAWIGRASDDARKWMLAALLVAVAGLAIITERLDHALGGLLATKEASGHWVGPATSDLVLWWFAVVLALVAGFTLAAAGINSTFRKPDWRRPTGWILAYVWAAWTVTGALSVSFGGFPQAVRTLQGLAQYAIAVLVVVVLVAIGNERRVSARATWRTATLVRVHLFVLAVLFGLIYLLPMTAGQAADVFRAWGDSDGAEPAFALAAALVLGEMIRESGLRIVSAEDRGLSMGRPDGAAPGQAPPAEQWDDKGIRAFRVTAAIPTGILFVGAMSAATDSVILDTALDRPVILTCVAALAFGLALVVLMRTVVEEVPARREVPSGVPPLVQGGILAVVGFVLTVLVAFVPLLAIAFVFPLLGFVEWQRRSGNIDTPIRWSLPLNGARVVALGVAVAVFWHPIDVARGIGVAGIALTACAALLGFLHLLVRRVGNHEIGFLHIRVPVIALLLAWAIFAVWQSPLELHQARTVAGVSDSRGSLSGAVGAWLDRELAVATPADGQNPAYLPLLLVGASGGGSKAAYWTDLVLDCVVGGSPPPDSISTRSECESDKLASRRARGVFLTSSVSGGSVGIAHYVQRLADVENGSPWVDWYTGGDVLSPTIAWGVFHDFPLMLVERLPLVPKLFSPDPQSCNRESWWDCRLELDRAAVQENAIARRPWDGGASPDEALTALWSRSVAPGSTTATPATVFNSALAGSRGRVLASPFDLAPESVIDESCGPVARNTSEVATDAIDAHDMLRGQEDFDVTTAALLSGRFPIIDPPARIGRSKTIEPKRGDKASCLSPGVTTLPAVFVRDGGYVENSGLFTITQLLPEIERGITDWKADNPGIQVVVWAVSIDDDVYDLVNRKAPVSDRPSPASLAAQAGPDTLTALARETLLLHHPPVDCYFRISPAPRIGAHAATGWELSKTVRAHDLIASVRKGSQNDVAIDAIRSFLAGDRQACEK